MSFTKKTRQRCLDNFDTLLTATFEDLQDNYIVITPKMKKFIAYNYYDTIHYQSDELCIRGNWITTKGKTELYQLEKRIFVQAHLGLPNFQKVLDRLAVLKQYKTVNDLLIETMKDNYKDFSEKYIEKDEDFERV